MIKTLFTALADSRSSFLQIFNFISKNKISSEEIDLIEEMLIETDIGFDITSDIIGLIEREAKAGLDLKNKIKLYLLNKLNAHSELDIKDIKGFLKKHPLSKYSEVNNSLREQLFFSASKTFLPVILWASLKGNSKLVTK